MTDKLFTIVDEDDNPIDAKLRDDITLEDRYRVAALWVTDKDGRILLARRGYTKSHNPGQWSSAVAGTVEEGETYEENIVKEALEELGLRITNPVPLLKEESHSQYKHFTQWFGWQMDGQEISPDPREVAEVRWFTMDELTEAVKENPSQFLYGMPVWLEKFKQL